MRILSRQILPSAILATLLLFSPASAQSGADLPQARTPQPGMLRPGDVIKVTVWPNAELGGEFPVEESGLAYLPVIGEVNVSGVPMSDLRTRLRQEYQQYSKEAVVSVVPMFRVGLVGEVQRPGLYVISPTHSLFDVINEAGGFRPTADGENVRIVREGEVVEVNATRSLESGEPLQALELRSGDQIVVPMRRGGTFNARAVLSIVQSVVLIATLVERLSR